MLECHGLKMEKQYQARENKQPLEAGKDKETNSLLRIYKREEPANPSTLAQEN